MISHINIGLIYLSILMTIVFNLLDLHFSEKFIHSWNLIVNYILFTQDMLRILTFGVKGLNFFKYSY